MRRDVKRQRAVGDDVAAQVGVDKAREERRRDKRRPRDAKVQNFKDLVDTYKQHAAAGSVTSEFLHTMFTQLFQSLTSRLSSKEFRSVYAAMKKAQMMDIANDLKHIDVLSTLITRDMFNLQHAYKEMDRRLTEIESSIANLQAYQPESSTLEHAKASEKYVNQLVESDVPMRQVMVAGDDTAPPTKFEHEERLRPQVKTEPVQYYMMSQAAIERQLSRVSRRAFKSFHESARDGTGKTVPIRRVFGNRAMTAKQVTGMCRRAMDFGQLTSSGHGCNRTFRTPTATHENIRLKMKKVMATHDETGMEMINNRVIAIQRGTAPGLYSDHDTGLECDDEDEEEEGGAAALTRKLNREFETRGDATAVDADGDDEMGEGGGSGGDDQNDVYGKRKVGKAGGTSGKQTKKRDGNSVTHINNPLVRSTFGSTPQNVRRDKSIPNVPGGGKVKRRVGKGKGKGKGKKKNEVRPVAKGKGKNIPVGEAGLGEWNLDQAELADNYYTTEQECETRERQMMSTQALRKLEGGKKGGGTGD